MKKLLVLAITIVMIISLAACGGVDKNAVIEAFNETNTQASSLAALANKNLDKMNQTTADSLNLILNAMAAYKAEIESDDLTQERADEIVTELKSYPAKIDEVKAKIDALIESGGGLTEEQAATLIQIEQSLADVYAMYAEYYDSLDDETKALTDEIVATINDIDKVLETTTAINSDEVDAFIQGVQGFLEAVELGWTEIEAQLQ